MNRLPYAAVIIVGLACASGCAGVTEGLKGFAGVSTKILEEKRPEALRKSFAMDYESCYNKTEKILRRINSYIYARTPDMFAVYVSEADTTPVGIFLSSQPAGLVLVEVSSPSTFAKETLAKTIFADMEKPLEELDMPLEPKE
ncbi:MAG: hypothetical protein PHR11_05125 [Candidatus Omnitrophica bacterium]|nr:hypothetical protein [Candidatus Omnitrophota bacterium]